jgi:sugar lactone lactonase YvrE
MTERPVTVVGDIEGAVLEGPVWCPIERALWLADILGPTLFRHDPATGETRRWTLPSALGSFALRRAGGLVLALRSGIHGFDPATGRLEKWLDAPYDTATTRFNDGRCDHDGRFFVTSMFEPRDRPAAALHRLDPDRRLHVVADGITIGNGLAVTPDGRGLFLADSPTGRVERFTLDRATGALADRRPFVTLPPGAGRPDGAAIDREGGYWVAGIGGWNLLRFLPDGRLDRRVALPVRWPTMPAFGGPELKTLYVTSLRHGQSPADLAASPLAGRLFALDIDVPGLPEPRFAG